jgi:(p)ppGpp synthase/HD superfamily hydrolase
MLFTYDLHATQRRKGPEPAVPYLGHLLGVCSIVIEDGGDEDEAIAALLHDAVEDAGGQPTLDQIRARFGENVASIVEQCSDTDQADKPPWLERKTAYLSHLKDPATPESVLRVSAADKLQNARALLDDYRRIGDELWARFTTGSASDQLWYYNSLSRIFLMRLNWTALSGCSAGTCHAEASPRPQHKIR